MKYLGFALCLTAVTIQSSYPMSPPVLGPVLGPVRPPQPIGSIDGPNSPGTGQRCVIDCGSAGVVPGTCLCQKTTLFPFIFTNTPCRFAKCGEFEACEIQDGKAVCVKLVNDTAAEDVCNLPSKTGPCRSRIERYFFDKTDGKCKTFIYGGCQGNGNSFSSKEDCEKFCITDVPSALPGVFSSPQQIGSGTSSVPSGNRQSDICRLPSERGMCFAAFRKFFFNVQTGQCEEFLYGGCGGNENRFETRDECNRACGGASSGTTSGAESTPTQVVTAASTVSADICQLPKQPGRCRGYFPNFFYNAASGQCERFVYGGCGGNENRFRTEDECSSACVAGPTSRSGSSAVTTVSADICQLPKQTGLCKAYFPSFYFNAQTGQCESFVYGGCGGNENRFDTREECTRACGGSPTSASRLETAALTTVSTDVCQLPKQPGRCRGYFPSFYYNAASGQCESFIYGGCGGNENRFDTVDKCNQACRARVARSTSASGSGTAATTTTSTDICQLPKQTGMCMAFFQKYYFNAQSGQCENFVYGGCGGNENRFETIDECNRACGGASARPTSRSTATTTTTTTSAEVCQLPKQTGRCRGYFPHFFFNAESGRCERFIYGGCGGNGNRFESIDECNRACGGPAAATTTLSSDICQLPKVSGPCEAYIPSFYYNSATGNCEQFGYGGCGGNANRFSSLADCQKRCQSSVTPRTDSVCSQPQVVGRCRARMPRFWYNSNTGVCQQFFYGGCGGNDNNFQSKASCESRCVTGSSTSAVPNALQTGSPGVATTRSAVPERCLQPKEAGPCRARQRKFYYDPTSGACRMFSYGGCRGNDNKFDSEAACKEVCLPTQSHQQQEPVQSASVQPLPPDVCTLPYVVGNCQAMLPRYYYNPARGRCQVFYYGGCAGNENNFRSYRACQRKCGAQNTRKESRRGNRRGPFLGPQ